MPRNAARTRSLAHALARHLVRVTAVAALGASGAASAAEELRLVNDDDDLSVLDGALRRATERVLSSPPEPEDRALQILLATREAVAFASIVEPEPRHTAALLEHAGFVEHFASEADALLWHVDADRPPKR